MIHLQKMYIACSIKTHLYVVTVIIYNSYQRYYNVIRQTYKLDDAYTQNTDIYVCNTTIMTIVT